ncbi:hypothetical protein Q3V30_11905 [Erwinia pyri]|uniref:Uncharacterized protein n=1 Tax=Erwinia pyri TaxID=3062598 RepID=A0AA50HNQ2_9GAMM|nr:hypothetical protein [Erwinia sp. DE2]WLS77195.1 hypothetical protein Q3V30_11905 [Erwinia sp. DE2]
MSLSYGWEKFHSAVLTLTGEGTVKERLANAYIFSLLHITPNEDLPNVLQADFEKLVQQVTHVAPAAQEGAVEATVNQLGEVELLLITEKIVGMYDDLCRHLAFENGAP